MIRNDNPDKGTETFACSLIILQIKPVIRNDNPDKGTETFVLHYKHSVTYEIRNDNPDKGTETVLHFF